MTEQLMKAATALEQGKIPKELEMLREIGKTIKTNPAKYEELRTALHRAENLAEQTAILNGFVLGEDNLRKLSFGTPTETGRGTPTIVITVTITVLTFPTPAHGDQG